MLSNITKDWMGVCFVATLGLAILIFVPMLFDLFEVLQMIKYVVIWEIWTICNIFCNIYMGLRVHFGS